MPERKFVEVVSKSTKQKQIVPAEWLEHGVPPFDDFELPPSAKAKDHSAPAVVPVIKKEAK